jgi:hypothetical protein
MDQGELLALKKAIVLPNTPMIAGVGRSYACEERGL